MNYVLAYGSLKSGKHNHCMIKGEPFLGKYYTSNNYTLILAGLPYLIERKGEGCTGEVYEVSDDCLERLDRFEQHPDWYERKLIPVYSMEDGTMLEVYAYIHPDIFNSQYPYQHTISREY